MSYDTYNIVDQATILANAYSRKVVETTVGKFGIANLCTRDFQSQLEPGTKAIEVCRVGAMSAKLKTGGGEYTPQHTDDEMIEIKLDKHTYIDFIVEDTLTVSSKVNKITANGTEAGRAIANSIETTIADAIVAGAGTNFGSLSTRLTPSGILLANKWFDDQKAPEDYKRHLFISSDGKSALLGETPFSSYSVIGTDQAVRFGIMPEIYGVIPVLNSFLPTSGSGKIGIMMIEPAVAVVSAPLPSMTGYGTSFGQYTDPNTGFTVRTKVSYNNRYGGLEFISDVYWGVKVLTSGWVATYQML
jgi:hypothetical protein